VPPVSGSEHGSPDLSNLRTVILLLQLSRVKLASCYCAETVNFSYVCYRV